MMSCIIFCHSELSEAGKTLQIISQYYEQHPTAIPFDLGLAQSKMDVMYPYWTAMLFDDRYLDEIDEWIYKAGISCGEVCVGVPRYREYVTLGSELQRLRCKDGSIEEIK